MVEYLRPYEWRTKMLTSLTLSVIMGGEARCRKGARILAGPGSGSDPPNSRVRQVHQAARSAVRGRGRAAHRQDEVRACAPLR